METMVHDRTFDGKVIQRKEPVGRWISLDEIMTELEKDLLFFDESKGGVTFSGGEPLNQYEFVGELARDCQRREIHTCLDTCGYAAPDALEAVMDWIDLVLFDLKLMDGALHKKYTGVSNEKILNNLEWLLSRNHPVIVRVPVIPGITDNDQNIGSIIEYLGRVSPGQEIHLLPYHDTASEKYRRLGIEDHFRSDKKMDDSRIEQIKNRLEEHGFRPSVGG